MSRNTLLDAALNSIRNHSYEQRLDKIWISNLEQRRNRGDLIQQYKFFNNLNKILWHHPNTKANVEGPADNTRGRSHKLVKQLTHNCKQREDFFTNRIVKAWNKPPHSIINSGSVNQFKDKSDKSKILGNYTHKHYHA